MKLSKKVNKTQYLVELAVLIAILLVLEVTNLGMWKFGIVELTIMQVPVIIGAITMGPLAGAILGGAFGAISFWECFGKSAFGAALLGINPVYTAIICIGGRVLMGWLCGLIFKGLNKVDKSKWFSYFGASLCGALLNTLFFMTLLVVLFGQTEFILSIQESLGATSILAFVVTMVGIQGLIEAAVSCVLGGSVSKAVARFKLHK